MNNKIEEILAKLRSGVALDTKEYRLLITYISTLESMVDENCVASQKIKKGKHDGND